MKTVKELAAQLGCSKSTLHRLIQKMNQERVIETVQRDNKILIDDAAEKAILKAFAEKSSHGDASCINADSVQERVKNESCIDFETKYIQQLEQQILDLKADKQYLQERLTAAEREKENLTKERQTILAELLELRQQTKVITVKTAEPVKADTTPPKRSQPRPEQRQPRKQNVLETISRLFRRS